MTDIFAGAKLIEKLEIPLKFQGRSAARAAIAKSEGRE